MQKQQSFQDDNDQLNNAFVDGELNKTVSASNQNASDWNLLDDPSLLKQIEEQQQNSSIKQSSKFSSNIKSNSNEGSFFINQSNVSSINFGSKSKSKAPVKTVVDDDQQDLKDLFTAISNQQKSQQKKLMSEVEQAISILLKKMIPQIIKNGQLTKYSAVLTYKKQYDQYERKYIQNSHLRRQLGNEYQSSDSQDEKQNKISQNQLKKIIRKRLIEQKYDEKALAPIKQKIIDQDIQDQQELISKKQVQEQFCRQTQLNIIQQAKEVVEEQIQRTTNFGLQFLIKGLQKIKDMPVEQWNNITV